jgi:serine/threonine protein kinase
MPRRHVALKLLPGGRQAGPGERLQWLDAQADSQVRHPNVVTLYEVAEKERWFVLVLEYIPGGTLADRLSRPVGPPHAARLMETIARAVHHIHGSGQLHLDLKPSNILVDGDVGGRWEAMIPKVSDSGIARSAEPGATDTGLAVLRYSEGDQDQAASLFAANLRLIQGAIPEAQDVSPRVMRLGAFIEAKLFCEGLPATLTGGTLGNDEDTRPALSGLRSPTDTSQSPEEWARLAFRAPHPTCQSAGDAVRHETRDVFLAVDFIGSDAAMFRRHDEPEKASRIDERLLAPAMCLVSTHPDEPRSHLALSQARLWLSKDSVQVDDWAAVMRNVELALDDAPEKALDLDSGSEEAQQRVNKIRRRLARRGSRIESVQSPGPFAVNR